MVAFVNCTEPFTISIFNNTINKYLFQKLMKYSIKMIDGRPFIHDGQGLFLLDTFLGNSFSRTGKIMFAGQEHTCPTEGLIETSESLSCEYKTDICGVISMDVLGDYVVLLDMQQGELIVNPDVTPDRISGVVEASPTIARVSIAGQPVSVALCTGMKTTYLFSDFVKTLEMESASAPINVCFSHKGKSWTEECMITPRYKFCEKGIAGVVGMELLNHFSVLLARERK